MIYIKNNTEIQTIFIPRNELQKEAYIASTKTYEDGYKDGFGEGKQHQKDQLLNLYVTENGEYEREDGWGIVTVDIPIGDCPECPEGGSCNLGEGEIYLTASDAGFYELYAADDGYDGWSKFYVTLEGGGAIKVHKASDLLDTFNNGEQIDFGAYYYVGGKITDIQEVSTQYGNATYILDNGFKVYRGKWIDKNQIKVGAYIVVYGIIQDYKGQLQLKSGSQVIAYQECEGGGSDCNIIEFQEYTLKEEAEKIYASDYGADGFAIVSIDAIDLCKQKYNEGVTAGKAEGSDLNIGEGYIGLTENERGQIFELIPSNDGYDAYSKVTVELHNFDLGGDTNIYDALFVHQLLMDGVISYDNKYIFKGQITEIQRIRPEYGDARYTLDGSLNVYNGQTMGYDLQVGDNVIVIGTLSEYNGAPQFSAGSEIKALWREGGSGNCDDAFNQGYMSGVNDGYNQGYNDGQATCEPCNLQHLEVTENGYYEPRAEEFGCLEMRENSAFDTGVRLLENSTIEILFNAGETWSEIPTLIGCEDSDWNNSTFAARWYVDTLFVRIGDGDVQIPLTPEDFWPKLHKLKFGRFEGVWFDDEYIGSLDWTDWVITQNTIYIGAMHNTTDSENGIWRPWNGFISNVTIYGEKNGESRDWHFEAGDFGKWGEYRCVETDEILPNLMGDGGASFQTGKQYGEPPFRGYSSVSVNVPSMQEQLKSYYYNPLTISDGGFGERAKTFNAVTSMYNREAEDWIYDYLYMPSFDNNNRIYTNQRATDIVYFPLEDDNAQYVGKMRVEKGVSSFGFNGYALPSLYSLEFEKDITSIVITNCNLSTLNTIKVYTNNDVHIDFSGTQIKDGGVLRIREDNPYKDKWISKLPSGWTIITE